MADFNYAFESYNFETLSFDKLYGQKVNVAHCLDVFYNPNTISHLENEGDSITLLGYAYVQKGDVKLYLLDILQNFDVSRISEIKQMLLGQYLIVIRKDSLLYLFSDFLQTRAIYYDANHKKASSLFDVLYMPEAKDYYKGFEFLAMRHCLYPTWLGDTTISHDVKQVRANEYLIIAIESGEMEVGQLRFKINNVKIKSLKNLKVHIASTLRKTICHPLFQEKKVYTTITGGFDSRLVTSLVKEFYKNTNLRISTVKGIQSLDYIIASKVAKELAIPLNVYETDPEIQRDIYFSLTEGLSPYENMIMTELFQSDERGDLGFGGAFGTELYTPLPYMSINELINDYVNKARKFLNANDMFYKRLSQALQDEFENIRNYYVLQVDDERDLMRMFQLLDTGRFSSRFISALHIRGREYEVHGTFPVIEAGLKIPYKYLGCKWTLGRYYLIPKHIVYQINKKVANIMTCHFCPMAPLTFSTFLLYVRGKFMRRQYYKESAKLSTTPSLKTLDTPNFTYTSDKWFDGFRMKYFSK